MKQTAVEWLVKDLIERHLIKEDDYVKTFINKSFEQAKAMEKEQMIDFAKQWEARKNESNLDSMEMLYEQTYNK